MGRVPLADRDVGDTIELAAVARGDRAPDTLVRNGRLVNVDTGEIQPDTTVSIANGRIAAVRQGTSPIDSGPDTDVVDADGSYVAPGFLDAHVHVESCLTTLTGFAGGALPAGTTGVFYEPHDTANVLGAAGVELLIEEGDRLPFRAWCTVPSCVPEEPEFEDSGGVVDLPAVESAMESPAVVGLGEVIDYESVIDGDEDTHEKLVATLNASKTVTGHFTDDDLDSLDAYAAAGVSSCHESTTPDDVLARLRRGMWTMLREGAGYRNVAETVPAVVDEPVDTRHLALVVDDLDPEVLLHEGHLDRALRVAVEHGLDPVRAVQAVTINPAEYYRVAGDVGSVAPGKVADIVVLEDLRTFAVEDVFVDGDRVVSDGELRESDTGRWTVPTDSVRTGGAAGSRVAGPKAPSPCSASSPPTRC